MPRPVDLSRFTTTGRPRQRPHHFFDALRAEVDHLWALRLAPDEIAAALGVTRTSIERAYYRHGQPFPWKANPR